MIDELSKNMTAPSTDDKELAELLDRYLLSLESNVPLDIAELAAAHPKLAADIRSFATCVETLHHATQGFGSSGGSSFAREPKGSDRAVAKRLGDFEIGPEIGRGGMGIVYEGRQISLQRKVALKVLPFAATWDQKQIARFRNEARAAAQLHHPNIVPVFAVGEERGVHFYAMQFIAGRSLDVVVAELRREAAAPSESTVSSLRTVPAVPSTVVAQTTQHSIVVQSGLSSPHSGHHTKRDADYCRAIARLGIQAAKALEYAHECGVIHRDIKPSNLMMDDTNKLWITDFGLALVQDSPSVTMTGDVVGTLRYMSPEQAGGKQSLVDARTDVYSLGASLYEMLTLQPAFPGDDRQTVLKAVADCEPKASRTINSAIPIDLETIVLEAMAKSRDERYASAGALADDLTRFLEGKPTHAQRPTVIDRASKWVRRHRVVVSLAAMFLLAITMVSTTGAILLSRAHSRTQAALKVAELNLQQARQVVDRFGSQFSQELARLPGSEPLRQEVLSDTLAYYQGFIARSANDPSLKKELATTHFKSGSIASRLGNQAAAEKSFREAADLFEELATASSTPTEFQQSRATCLNNLALLFASQGNHEQARQAYAKAIELQSNVASSKRDDTSSARLLAEMLTNRGLLERQSGESAAARNSLSRAIDLLNKLRDQHPDDLQAVRGLALALNNRSFVEQETNWQSARESCEAALALFQQLATEKKDEEQLETPTLAGRRSDLALCYNNFGSILGHLQLDNESVAAYRKAVEIQTQLVRQSPSVVQYRSELAITWNNLGQVLAKSDAPSSGMSYDSAEELFAQLVADYPKEIRFRSSLAGVLNNRAMAAELAGDLTLALASYEAAIQHQLAAVEQGPQQTQHREYLSKHYFNYARALRAVGKPVKAAQIALERRQLWPSHSGHLYQVALELVMAAELIENDSVEHGHLFDEALATLEQVEAAGGDLKALGTEQPLSESFQRYRESRQMKVAGGTL